MRPEYEDITFYCHNLSGYDVIFIVNVINKYNENTDIDNQYKLEPLLRDSKIIKLTIKKGKRKVTLTDSLCILTSSLAKLGKDFEVQVQKSFFPYKFSIKQNLFYVGPTPSIDYYNGISLDKYNNIKIDN